jgi:hypothetical protein
MNFYLFNAKAGKCVLIHSIDVSKQAAPALRISSVPGSTDSNNICNSIDGNSIIKNINTIYVGWDSSFLVPSISNIKKSKEGVSIKYQYKLKKTSLLHTATLFVTHKVVNQLEEKLNK